MALRATKDTFVLENTGGGPGTEVRRQVMAGDVIFQGEPESAGDFEEYDAKMTAGLGAAPPAYKRQLDDDGRIKDEHLPDEEDADEHPVNRAEAKTRRAPAKKE